MHNNINGPCGSHSRRVPPNAVLPYARSTTVFRHATLLSATRRRQSIEENFSAWSAIVAGRQSYGKCRFLSVESMRLPLVLLFLALFSSPAIQAQTPAQKALNAEPEVQQIREMTKDLNERQNLPDDDVRKPSVLMTSVQSLASLKTYQALLDRLEARLESEAQACNYCAAKQEELSELIRQRQHLQNYFYDALMGVTGGDASAMRGLSKLLSVVPIETRWQNRDIALREAQRVIDGHCQRLNAAGSNLADCQATTEGGAFKLAAAHENAWADCFQKHNWVKTPSERLAYEACMNATDPLTKLCNDERKVATNPQYYPRFTVTAFDLDMLQFYNYNDRWLTDPNRLPALVVLLPQSINVTLLEPVVVPPPLPTAPSTGPGRLVSTVRARLENSLEGGISGSNGRAVVVQRGAEVKIDFDLSTADRASCLLSLRIVSATASGERPHRLVSGSFDRRIPGWPAAGTMLIPANSPLTFQSSTADLYPMSQAEFLSRAAANASSAGSQDPNSTYVTRPILAGSRIQTILIEPVDVPGIQADKRFHAQLNADSELPRGVTGSDGIKLPRGTDVYLRVTDTNANPQFQVGHTAHLFVDYAIINGEKVPLHTASLDQPFTVQMARLPNSRSNSRRPAVSDVLWPVGDTKWFDITEQTEVSRQILTGGGQLQPTGAVATTAAATVTSRDAQQNNAAPNATQTRPSRGKGSAAAVPSSPPQAPAAQPTNIPAPAPANTPANVPVAKPLSAVPGVAGTYEGKYECSRREIGFRLDVTLADNDSMTAVFRSSIPGVPPFDLAGQYDSATKQFVLTPVRWESRPPGGYAMVGMQGTFDPSDGTLKGKVTEPRCGAFELIRKEP